MKNALFFLVFILLFLQSCKVIQFSKGRILHDIIEKGSTVCLDKDSKLVAATFNKRPASDTSALKKIHKFNEGCYVIRIKESIQEEKMRNKRVLFKTYETDNDINPSFTDKMIYLVFLDDQRVLYHSPFRRNYLKTGEIGKLKDIQKYNIYENKNTDSLKKRVQRKIVRKTDNYFKLDFHCEYNTSKRGYYKVANDSLFICMEKGDSKSVELMGLNFKLTNNQQNFVEKLTFSHVLYKDNSFKVDSIFRLTRSNKESKSSGKTKKIKDTNYQKYTQRADYGIDFQFFEAKFHPLLVFQNLGLVKEIVNQKNERIYKILCNLDGCNNVIDIVETEENFFTW